MRRRRTHLPRARSDTAGRAGSPPPLSGAPRGYYLGEKILPLQSTPAFTERGGLTEPGSLFETITSTEVLAKAWSTLLAKDARDGQLQRETQAIAANLDRYLADLSTELRTGTYIPNPLTRIPIPKKTPGERRILHVPTIRDRLVERAVVDVIAQPLDRVQSPCSFAYRIGLGVDDAVDHLATLRDHGNHHVLRTDIDDFFPHVLIDDALEAMGDVLECRRTRDLIRLIASPRRAHHEPRARSRGVAQGSCLSPLLANLSFTSVDLTIGDAGYGYVRFADDIVLCGPTRSDVIEAFDTIRVLAAALGFPLNEDKTMVTTFDEGFSYLGVDFSATLPQVDPHHDVDKHAHPDKVVYVGQDGARVRVSRERLIVDGPTGLPHVSIPRRAVNRIVLTGTVGLSAGARSWALYNDIDVVFLSRHGNYLGQLSGPRSTTSARRLLAQAELAENDHARLPLAQAIIRAKIRHQLNVIHRAGRRDRAVDITTTCGLLRTLLADTGHAGTIDELMGIEGAASTQYFSCLAALVPDDVTFPRRSRRPPKDLANAALSYAYAILLSECTGALIAAGLEPSLGVLHASTDKRPSLSLDLMEEFRPLLVDRTVVSLLRSHRLRPEHATASEDGEGIWLNREGKKALVDGYEATLQRRVKGALPGFSGTWRRHIHHAAQLLGRAITEPDYEWTGVSWR